MRGSLENPPRIFLCPSRHRTDQAQRRRGRAAQPAGRPVQIRRPAAKKTRLPVACFGHAGDGNIHTNVMVDYTQPGAKTPRRSRAGRIVPLGNRRGRRHQRRTRHRSGEKALVAAGDFSRSPRTPSHREARPRPERHLESRQVCIGNDLTMAVSVNIGTVCQAEGNSGSDEGRARHSVRADG